MNKVLTDTSEELYK